jgi:hypothetical protein
LARLHTQGLIVLGSPFTFANARLLAELAAGHRISATYETKVFVVDGMLVVSRLGEWLVRKESDRRRSPRLLAAQRVDEIRFELNELDGTLR